MSAYETVLEGSVEWDGKTATLCQDVLVLCCDHAGCKNTYLGRPGFYRDTCINAASDTGWWGWDRYYDGPHFCGDHPQP